MEDAKTQRKRGEELWEVSREVSSLGLERRGAEALVGLRHERVVEGRL